jgi:hypothetical protein
VTKNGLLQARCADASQSVLLAHGIEPQRRWDFLIWSVEMDETPVKALLDLCKLEIEHEEHMQQIEWKCNFGIWTLLAGAIYIVTKEPVQMSRSWTGACLSVLTILHVCWLYGVRRSEEFDKESWTDHRSRVLRLIGAAETEKDSRGWTRSLLHRVLWLSVEGMMTFLLCAFLFFSLPR